ncbi:hypothetical protein, partial [Limnoraphis robusta]|uniref:hypothetical protein n=1 Tax=Limnoraphis robusta TaxID=1118279 RepID=UPI002B1FD6DC
QDKEAMPQERARKTFGDLISEERLGAPLARSADKALQEILPDLHAALSGGRSYAGRPATGRLSHPHYYSRYFSYTAWSADAPDSEVDARWVSVLRGASFADEFMTLLRIPDGPRFLDKLVRAIDKAPADVATAARILLQMEEVVRTEEWQREVVSSRLFGDRSAMTMLEFVAVHMLQHAHGFDDPYPALRALSPVRSSRLVYDASHALLQTMRGTNADADAFVAVGDQMVLERLREPGEFEWYRRHPSLVVDPARSAVRNGGSVADAWTRSIMDDASLMTVVLELTKNLSSEATPEALLGYLQQFVDLPVALPALRVLADVDERAAFWIELIEAAEPGLS